MKIVVASEKKVQYFNVPENVEESYTVTFKDKDNKKQHITLEKTNDSFYCLSNELISIVSGNDVLDKILVQDNCKFSFIINGSSSLYEVYCFSSAGSSYFLDYDRSSSLSIGNNSNCNICLNCNIDFQIKIFIKNNIYYFNSDKNVYCNSRVCNEKKLFVGDTLFIFGIEIIWMEKFIVLRCFNNSLLTINAMGQYNVDGSREYASSNSNISSFYNENDKFYHIPRMRQISEIKDVEIDSPPESKEKDEIPTWVNSLTRITMITYAFIRAYAVYEGVYIDGDAWSEHISNIVLCAGSLVGSIIAPLIVNKFKKNANKKYEEKRIKTYTEYLQDRERIILNAVNEEKQILLNENISALETKDIIINRKKSFWSKRYNDDDFLTARLGLGQIDASLNIKAPEKHFVVDKDDLLEKIFELTNKYNKINGAPIVYSFKKNKVTSVISNANSRDNFIKQIILQIITTHSPLDLKILIYTDEDRIYKWDFLKTVPHIFSDDRSIRFIVNNDDASGEVYNFFIDEVKKDEEDKKDMFKFSKKEEKIEGSYYLIITDDYKDYKSDPLINFAINSQEKENSIFSLLIIDDNMKNIPSECVNFIELGEDSGITLNTNINSKDHLSFLLENKDFEDFKVTTKLLSTIPISLKSEDSQLPPSLTFLNMYEASKIEHLNIADRWKNNNPVNSLSAVVGVHKNKEQFKLNLHEKSHGPHGLIAGSTGSGKSEFIITYILSMALEYHPYEVQFVLIDYKGGGLAGAFENKEFGIRLPHLVGTITNLDVSEMNRTLVSIQSEIKRRQKVFNKCREKLNESTIDIYKYQRFYRDGLVSEPLSHLFIISDEFAELKSQRPEFMSEIISIARIGRSLGIHLILATQKPTGVVNDQIWSNSKFKVCLKVQNKSDSMEMLKRPEAASIKETGRFYLQVGYDEYFDIGQSGWSGANYVPTDKIVEKIDKSVVFINDVGNPIKSLKIEVPEKEEQNVKSGDQLTNIVQYISDLGKKENLLIKNLWLDAIPEEIFINSLQEKYDYQKDGFMIKPIIGEYDLPKNQSQKLLTLNLTSDGNTIICGQNGSGKDKLLSTLLYSSMNLYSPEEVNFYIIDCSSEVLKKFENYPHVGGFLTTNDKTTIEDLLVQITDEIEYRKSEFINYGGNYIDFMTRSERKMPLITLIVHGFEIFTENFMNYVTYIQNIARDGEKLGITVIVSFLGVNAIKSKLSQSFQNLIALQLANETDYRMFLNCDRNLMPKKNIGRGLVKIDGESFEFQSALITNEEEFNYLKNNELELNSKYSNKAKSIMSVPDVVKLSLFNDIFSTNDNLPVGFDIKSRRIQFYNFEKNNVLPVVYKTIDTEKTSFINTLTTSLSKVDNNKVLVFDVKNVVRRDIDNVDFINQNFSDDFIKFMKTYNEQCKYFIFVGMTQEIEKDKVLFTCIETCLKNIEKTNKLKFIFVDTAMNMNSFISKDIIMKNYNKTNGIWLGSDIAMQTIFNINKMDRTDTSIQSECLSYFINNKNYNVVKHFVEDDYE